VKTFHNLSTGRNRPDIRSKRSKAGGHQAQGVKIPANSGPVKGIRPQIKTVNGEKPVQRVDSLEI